MKRFLFPLVILLLGVLIVTGCSSGPTTTAPSTSTAPVPTAISPATTASALPSPLAATTVIPKPASPSSLSATNSKYGGFLKYATIYPPGNPTGVPWQTSGPTVISSQLCLQPLLKEKTGSTDMSNLASSFDVDAKSATPSITFHLRKGIKFHDGSDFNAQAVKWNLEQQMDPTSVTYGSTNTWKSVVVIDDYTVKVNVSTWQNTLIPSFATNPAFMVSPTAYQKNGLDWMKYHMVGTGPFMQTDYQQDVSLTTVKNPNYWEQGFPYLDKLQMLYIADDLTRVALFKSGGSDILSNGRNPKLASELQAAGYEVVVSRGNGSVSLIPDSINADSPWSNLKVRMAAEYAIDKVSIAKTFGYGYTNALNQMNTSVSMAYDKTLPGRNYDVAKAKQLLADAGYPNGFKTSIIASPMLPDRNMVIVVQSFLSKVGIQCDLQFPQAAAYSAISTGGTWNNALLFSPTNLWANPNTVFNYYFPMPGVANKSVKRPDGWKELLDASKATPVPDPALIKQLEDALYNDVTMIPINDSTYPWIIDDSVHDHGIGTFATDAYWEPQYTWMGK